MGYREERRADRTAERAQDREDQRLLMEGQLAEKREAAEQRRRDEEFARRQKQQAKKQKQREKAEARVRRAATYGRAAGWLRGHQVDVFVGFVMAASVVPALISQVGALGGAHVDFLLAALLAAMLEGAAWALTFMGKAAEDESRETRKYRIATWCTAALAAGINFWHWQATDSPTWVAAVFGASSLFAIFIWDLRTHGSHGPTRAERREARARRRHVKKRRKDHRDETALADRLVSAAPYGALDEEAAFAAAWRIEHGAEPGMTQELYERSVDARLGLGEVLATAGEISPHLIRSGLLRALETPLPHTVSEGIPTLGPVAPIRALPTGAQDGAEDATTQFPQGLYGSEAPSQKRPEKKTEKGRGNASNGSKETPRTGRSESELEAMLPKAHTVAADLVAEGRQISAASMAKGLGVRREDGMWLRDRVIAERKLRVVEAAS